MRRPRPQPVHRPSGISPETYRTSRRWLVAGLAAVIVLIAAVIAALQLRGA